MYIYNIYIYLSILDVNPLTIFQGSVPSPTRPAWIPWAQRSDQERCHAMAPEAPLVMLPWVGTIGKYGETRLETIGKCGLNGIYS